MALALTECCSCNCNGNEWKVQLAQFVPPPSLQPDKKSLSPFKPMNKPYFPANGTWISSSSPAMLTLLTANSAAKIQVKLHGKIHEEHLISRLKFTWPQISCRAKYGTAGSRVVFATYYRECLYKGIEKSKFALQFDTAIHARDFLSVIQNYGAVECSLPEQETLQTNKSAQTEEQLPTNMLLCDESSASKLLALHKPQTSGKIGGVTSDETDTQKQEMNSSIKTGHSKDFSEQQWIFNQLESNCPELPPRFSSYLEKCNIALQIETVPDETDTQKQEMSSSLKTGHSQDFSEQQGIFNQLESNCPELPPRFSSSLEKCNIASQIETVPDETDTQKQEMSSSLKTGHSQDFSEQQGIFNQLESNCPELPPRFSSYLEKCNIASQIETVPGKIQSPHTSQNDPPEMKASTNDLKAQVTACILDPSFQEFVSKVEKVWYELHEEMTDV